MSLSQIRLATAVSPAVSDLLKGKTGSELQDLEQLIESAARANGDGYLSADEFALVQQGAEAVTQYVAAPAQRGVQAHFDGDLEAKLVKELTDAVTRAAGRKIDINMMIFEFQSDTIEQTIVDLASQNSNVTFRIVADSGQASTTGGNALPSLLKHKLPNVFVKYKKDFPYTWNDARGMPVYSHNATQGLNHHKGFMTTIDGQVDRLVSGSFNWSKTANEKNYEDLVVMHALDEGTRTAATAYLDEFTGFYNNEAACLPPNAFAMFKREQWNAMCAAHGAKGFKPLSLPADNVPAYEPTTRDDAFDFNGTSASDRASQASVLGAALLQQVDQERATYGRFASFEQLAERVSGIGSLSSAAQASLRSAAFFGIAPSERTIDARFNSREFAATAGGTGYGARTGARTDGAVNLGATEMFDSAQPGEELCVAMYGMSATSKETKALIAAAKRGVRVRAVLNDEGNEAAAALLKAIPTAEVRIQKARTMHEKFGIKGNDVFYGSANFSESSSSKHSEDRFTVRGDATLATSFKGEFETLWTRSKPV